MALEINIDLKGMGGFRRYLDGVAERMVDLRPAWRQIDPVIKEIVRENFRLGGRPRWKPRKGEKKYGGVLLRRDGRLYLAAIHPTLLSKQTEADWVAHVGEEGVAHHYGSQKAVMVSAHDRNIKVAFGKALSAQKSIQIKSHMMQMNLPARPFFCIPTTSTREIDRITRIVNMHIFLSRSGNDSSS